MFLILPGLWPFPSSFSASSYRKAFPSRYACSSRCCSPGSRWPRYTGYKRPR
jgi:hypothetical protein